MRACFAILKDSFREAAASRVLSIALIGIVVVLLALSPLGLSSVPSTKLRPFELVDTEQFVKTIVDGKNSVETPAGHIWSLMNDEQKAAAEDWLKPNSSDDNARRDQPGPPRRGRIQGRVLDFINGLLKKPDFYRPESWVSIEMDDELRSTDDPSMAPDTLAVRNLKRFALAFPQSVNIQDEMSLSLTYGSITLFGPLRAPPEQTNKIIDSAIIAILSIFLGFFGVFSSLLVTSTIIPRTFEPGEISLLLSKPVRRSVLFVTKFIGGCAFTLLCAGVLVTGVWFLLWLRFDLWRPELLLCIPLYVFLFAVYFSVSAVAGAIWRNATVSLILVVVFWIVVTTAGAIHGFMDNIYIRSQQIVEVTVAGSEIFVVDGSKTFSRWDADRSDWSPIFEQTGGNSFQQAMERMMRSGLRIHPVASPDGAKIIALQPEFSRFGGAAPATLVTGHKENNYAREVESAAPEPVFGVFQTRSGDIILPGTRGVYQFAGVSDQTRKFQEFSRGYLGGLFSSSSKAFETLTTKEMETIRGDASVAFNPVDDSLVIWNNGKLLKLVRKEDGKYEPGPTREFEKKQSAIVATGGDFILCALADGQILALDAVSLETIAEGSIPKGEKPKRAELTADGNWGVVLTHAGNLVTFGGQEKSFLPWTPRENGTISAISFDSEGQLIVANGRRSLSFYQASSQSPVKSVSGQVTWPFHVYDLVILPLYKVLPKPSELDNAVRYLVTGEKSVVIDSNQGDQAASDSEDLSQNRVSFDLWSSFWSNVGFIAVMLTVGCVYLMRRDF